MENHWFRLGEHGRYSCSRMPFDIRELSPEHFVLLSGRLLQANGLSLDFKSPRSRDIGIDFVGSVTGVDHSPTYIVEVIATRLPVFPFARVRQAAEHLLRFQDLVGADQLLLIAGSGVSDRGRAELKHHDIELWDEAKILELLGHFPKVKAEFEALLTQYAKVQRRLLDPFASDQRGSDLASMLTALPAGRDHWREYEDICIDILNHVFQGMLGTPAIQSSSDDGLDRRDAIYPILNGNSSWEAIRSDCRTRMVVAEFKNYTDPPGQKEVESLQQYLFDKGMRTFGILCTRQLPSKQADIARRRVWVESNKLIVMFSDNELIEMLQLKAIGEDPTVIVDDQLNAFFLTLTP